MNKVFLNGNYIEDSVSLISHRDSGFTTSIGIFDSMLAQEGDLINAQEHFMRLLHDTQIVIGKNLEMEYEEFKSICMHLMQINNLTKDYARIRTTITGGIVKTPLAKSENLTILIDVAACQAPSATPIICKIITDFPRIAGCILENCKRLDYSRSYAARRKAESLEAQDAILTNTDGNIACGATSNIFIEENGILITPPLSDGVLAGISRRKLIEERNVREESISPDRLQSADKIYLTNSFIGLGEVKLI